MMVSTGMLLATMLVKCRVRSACVLSLAYLCCTEVLHYDLKRVSYFYSIIRMLCIYVVIPNTNVFRVFHSFMLYSNASKNVTTSRSLLKRFEE